MQINGYWQRTPLLWRLFGRPYYRRWITVLAGPYLAGRWEYADVE